MEKVRALKAQKDTGGLLESNKLSVLTSVLEFPKSMDCGETEFSLAVCLSAQGLSRETAIHHFTITQLPDDPVPTTSVLFLVFLERLYQISI